MFNLFNMCQHTEIKTQTQLKHDTRYLGFLICHELSGGFAFHGQTSYPKTTSSETSWLVGNLFKADLDSLPSEFNKVRT